MAKASIIAAAGPITAMVSAVFAIAIIMVVIVVEVQQRRAEHSSVGLVFVVVVAAVVDLFVVGLGEHIKRKTPCEEGTHIGTE